MDLLLERLKEVADYAVKNNWQYPPGWTSERYRQIRNYCLEELDDHQDGRQAAILGGQAQKEAMNQWLWQTVDILQEARKKGLIDE